MTEQCKALVARNRQCSRRAVDRGWCKQHAIPVAYILSGEVERLCEDIHCPCEWGEVVSPAYSFGKDDELAVCCIDCDRTTPLMPLATEADIPAIVEAWKAVCRD